MPMEKIKEDSILTSIKKLLGITEEYTHFDTDIIIHINSAIMTLNQIGVGVENFRVRTKDDRWSDFIKENVNLEGVKDYVYLKVKLVFDPPNSGYTINVIKEEIKELECRLNMAVDPVNTFCDKEANL